MSKSRRRSIKSAQVGLREINLQVNGSLATPTATGFDQFGVSSVIDNGVGNYTIVFKSPFERVCACKSLAMITADAIARVSAVAKDRITIETFDSTDGTTPKEADFYLCVLGSDFKYDI